MNTPIIRRGFPVTVSFTNVRTVIVLLGLLILFGLIYVGQSTQATLNGQRVQDLQEKLDRLNRENAQLQYDIAVLTAPSKIADRARAQGLRPATSTQMVFLTVKDYPVSATQPTPITNKPTQPSFDSPVAAWWNQFSAWAGLAPSPRTAQAKTSP